MCPGQTRRRVRPSTSVRATLGAMTDLHSDNARPTRGTAEDVRWFDAPGTNGFATAALVCGLLAFIPVAAILAVVFGIIALRQLGQVSQRGRGRAVAGVVLGSLVILAWAALTVRAFTMTADREEDGSYATSGVASVDTLQPGDCFSGVEQGTVRSVTVHPCTTPHEAQLVATVPLDGPFPGVGAAGGLAQQACLADVEALISSSVGEQLGLVFLYSDSALGWAADPTVGCVVVAVDGEMTGSLLK